MSFSKARLRRFNEEISQVPSPGRYDPKKESSVKGVVMPTSKRFPGQTVTSSSLDNIEKASTASMGVVFRTPQVMRKVRLTTRIQYLREKNLDTSGSDVLSSEERVCGKTALKKTVSKADYKRLEDELHSLTHKFYNELLDKESEVNMLKEEIKEIKIHETELKEILEEKSKLASDRHQETLQLKDNLETVVDKIKVDREEHQRFINDLKLEISELQNKKYELETVLAEKQSVIVTINDKYSDLENELKNLQEENMILEQANSCILTGAEQKIQGLEEKVISELESLPKAYDGKYEEDQRSFQTKMNFLVHEFNLKSKELIDQVKHSQERVKTLERLIDKKVKEFTENIKEADERCKYLYRELCKVEEQRDELVVSDLEKKLAIIDIQEKFEKNQNELDQCKNTCRKYQITLATMKETIAALSNRLFESEQEVERLNVVEKDLESQKVLLEEKSQLLLTDILALRESLEKVEEEIIRDVSELKEYLEAKADLFKEQAVRTEQSLNSIIHEKQCAIDVLFKENEYFKNEIERKDQFNKERQQKYEEEIKKLKSEQSKLEDELSEKVNAQKNITKILNDKLDSAISLVNDLQYSKSQHESLVKQLEELNLENTSKIQSLESDIERRGATEIRQQQYIDELISDLVLEKERCEAAETEKDRIQGLLDNATLEQSKEVEKLSSVVESLKQSLKDCERQKYLVENDKAILEQRVSVAETNLAELQTSKSEVQMELEQKITDLQCQLSSAKEKIKTEIPKLERENIDKAENILELNLNIDSLREEMDLQKTKISCLEAEKDSLKNVLDESKSKICDLQKMIQDKNLTISALKEEQIQQHSLSQDLIAQLDSMSSAYEKQNEDLKRNADNAMKLIEAEEKLSEMEMRLSEKDKELEQRISDSMKLDEINDLREKLQDIQAKYGVVVEEKKKLIQENGDLMGHQNINQKIKKVAELKQHIAELQDENKHLLIENQSLKSRMLSSKKQMEDKENSAIPRKEERASKPCSARKKLMSPGVLKPSNY